MLDATLRPWLRPGLDHVAATVVRLGIAPIALTMTGLVLGLAAAVAAAFTWWTTALALWLISRLFDGLDGPVARVGGRSSVFGGWADFTSDMTVYGAFVAGCAIGQPDARVACLVLLVTYYVNAGTLLGFSSAAERARIAAPDDRTFHFTRGLAEGTETIIVHAMMVAFPAAMAPIVWVFAAMVLVTVGQRVVLAHRVLRALPDEDARTVARTVPPSPRTADRDPLTPDPVSPVSGSRPRRR